MSPHSRLAFAFAIAFTATSLSAQVVTRTADTGPGTLRDVLATCNAPCSITFDPTVFGAPQTINLMSALVVNKSVVIDGFSGGGTPNTSTAFGADNAVRNVTLSGASCTSCTAGIQVTNGTTNVRIAGLNVENFPIGVSILGSTTVLSGNAIRNNSTGVSLSAATFAADSNTIGGSAAADRNIISSNRSQGIHITTPGVVSNTTIQGNFIGTDATGGAPAANGTGILVDNSLASGTLIDANLVAGNTNGISLAVNGAVVQNNLVGTSALGNAGPGLSINASGTSVTGNSFRSNSSDGVEIVSGTGNVLNNNVFEGNGGIGIDLRTFTLFDGPDPNDPTDADSGGGNNMQNHPVIDEAYLLGSTTSDAVYVRASIDSSGSASGTQAFLIELSQADASGQGIRPIGTQCFFGPTTTIDTTFAAAGLTPGSSIVLTATSYSDTGCPNLSIPSDGTSEFSAAAVVNIKPGLVTNTLDSGPGSLRQAILDANSGLCQDGFRGCDIDFSIPTSDGGFDGSTFTIQPATPLPRITRSSTSIRGQTQRSYAGDTNPNGPEIVLNGALLTAPDAAGLAVGPLAPADASVTGVWIDHLVINGFLGHGVLIDGRSPALSAFHEVTGSYLGTDAAGSAAVPNGNGITLGPGSEQVIIGGANEIPMLRTGPAGFAFVFPRNLISGNRVGILLTDSSLDLVEGNRIGTTADGVAALPNGIGISINGTSLGNVFGGNPSTQSNTVAFNVGEGIVVNSTTATGNRFAGNSIHSNGALGIDLFPIGVTPNDLGDADVGANNLQNFPVITSQTYASGMTTVTATLDSLPAESYTIEFFSSSAPDPTGYGEGEVYLGEVITTTDATGHVEVTMTFSGTYRWVTATATLRPASGYAETSEFSAVLNSPPTAANDAYTTSENTTLTVAAPGVLGNDSDPNQDAITAVLVTGPTNGTLTLNADGSFTYVPAAAFDGTDSFTYTANDQLAASNVATVTITVTNVNVAPVAANDTYTTPESTTLVVAAPGVLANDTDADGDPLMVASSTAPANGTLTLNSDGSFTYTPNAGFNGTDSFTYQAADGALASNVATVTINVTAVNSAPVANADNYSTSEGTTLTVPVLGVLANDSDADGDPLMAILVSGTSNGTVSLNSSGGFTYTPNAGFSGTDTFTYQANDGTTDSNIATVTIVVNSVNSAPVGNADSYSTDQDVALNVPAPGVLANDSDADNDPLIAVLVSSTSNGTLFLGSDGSFSYTPAAGFSGTDSFSYKPRDSSADGNVTTVTIDVVSEVTCPPAPVLISPSDGATNVPTSGQFEFQTNGSSFEIFYGPAGQGCSTSRGITIGPAVPYSGLQPNTEYEWRVDAHTPGCPVVSSPCARFRTASSCTTAPPTPLTPSSNATVTSPVAFTWTAVPGATSYTVFAPTGAPADTNLGSTTGTSLSASVPNGATGWYVVATGVPGCGDLRSVSVNFRVCNAPDAPLAGVVGESTSGQTYTVSWTAVPGASRYEVLEANNAAFVDAESFSTESLSLDFTKTSERAVPFFYQVRAFSECFGFGPASPTIRVVVVPVPPRENPNPSANIPFRSDLEVVMEVFFAGEPDQTFRYEATTDQEWMTVRPASGLLPPEGVTLQVLADPTDLPNGTVTGTVILTLSPLTDGRATTQSNHTRSTPVSINLVTPVVPTRSGPPTANSLIIPAVGHLDGSDARWRSDVRIANIAGAPAKYLLTFTPGDPTQGVKQTSIDVAPGETTALDDIVRAWYGLGSLGESSNGVLEVRPLTAGGNLTTKGVPDVSLATVVSSRTYAATTNGTLGEFIPGIPFGRFVGLVEAGTLQPILNLQQIAQNASYRTNVGVVEGSGLPVSTMLSIFNSAGDKLQDIPLTLRANEQRQLNSLLAQHGITLSDGRVEIRVTGGEGRVTGYAAVVDNRTKDQLFVPATTLGTTTASKYVMPGIADLNTGQALWRSDIRLFNSGTTSQNATLTLYPQNNSGAPLRAEVSIAPGAVEVLDDVVRTLFGASNIGGAVHVETPTASPLIATARTYNQTQNGTLGLFIPAVTPDEAIGTNGRSLNIVQAEDSVRYRTNVGIAEVTGRPATVEVTVHLPGSKVTPRIEIPLEANEFRQLGILRELGIGNVYNARLSMRVIEGEGKVTAYGSVIDMKTNDSTYVPAQ